MRVIIIVAAMAALAGCSSSQAQFTPRPVSVGGSPNSLKRTPCACNEKKQPAGLPSHLEAAGEKVAA